MDGLERNQEEFHQAFNVRMEDVEEDVQILKNNVDIVKIEMLSAHKGGSRVSSCLFGGGCHPLPSDLHFSSGQVEGCGGHYGGFGC